MLGDDVAPSTVVYRSENTRTSLQQLIDTVAANADVPQQHGDSDSASVGSAAAGPLSSNKVSPPPAGGKGAAVAAMPAMSGGVGAGGNGGNGANGGTGEDDSEEDGGAAAALAAAAAAAKLDWKEGVFVPCLLNIWGVIMFLRLGWVVGQAGIWMACLIVLASKVVTTLTALSLCAICTNGEVKGGGVYFLISRALGPVFGGTIGVLFFLAQAVATSLYVIGFAEAMSVLLVDSGVDYFTGSEINDIRVIGLGTSVLLLLVALVGVSWYAKTQMGLLVTLLLAMASVFIGAFFPAVPDKAENAAAGFVGFGWRNLGAHYIEDPAVPGVTQTFFTVFSVFFPAATGVMAGANMSGDLKDPSSAIPKGTLGAVSVTFVSYIALVWVVGLAALACADDPGEDYCANVDTAAQTGDVPAGGLLFNKLIMQNMSIWAPLLYMGVFAATLSSALASLVGAPRILQSVASDKLFPWPWFNFFGAGRGAANEPVRAYLLTFVICCGCVLIGKLDVIAPLISNFFMVSYAFTNYACFASSFARYPGWRPSFRYYNKWLSLFGFVLCIVVMFMMDWLTALLTVIMAGALYGYLLWLDPDVNWGAAGEARQYFQTLRGMERLQEARSDHVKTFRPQFLVMSGRPRDRAGLVKFVSMLKKGGGIMVCGDVIIDAHIDARMDAAANGFAAAAAAAAPLPAAAAPPPALGLISEGEEEEDEEEEDNSDGGASDGDDKSLGAEESAAAAAAAAGPGTAASAASSVAASPRRRDSAAGGSKDAHMELASRLAARLATVRARRQEGDDFFSARDVWGARRCPGAFFDAVVGDSLLDGFQSLLQCAGVGRLRPNTVVVGFKSHWQTVPLAAVKEYEQMIRITLASNLGVMVLRDEAGVFDELSLVASSGVRLPCLSAPAQPPPQPPSQPSQPRRRSPAAPGLASATSLDALEAGGAAGDSARSLALAASAAGQAHAQAQAQAEGPSGSTLTQYASVVGADGAGAAPTQLSGDTIDVWWVADDGGLTMLIPHLLKAHRALRANQRLRVLTVTNYSTHETSKLQKTEFRMVHLLKKFRIEADVEAVEGNLLLAPSAALAAEFDALGGGGLRMADLSEQERSKTSQTLRLVELMRERSSGPSTSMVFVTLPIPETGFSVGLHLRWMHMLSAHAPPTVLMRGNNENVLTFIC